MLLMLFSGVSHASKDEPYVIFANPGGENDAFFMPVTEFMQAAADDLGVELKVIYTDREHSHVEYAEGLEQECRVRKPDYIIGMNPRGAGQRLLETAQKAGVKTVVFNQGFLGKDRLQVGSPGSKYSQWAFEYLPDDVHSGYLLAKTLIEQAEKQGLHGPDGRIHVVGINGHHASPASILRQKGLEQAVAESPNATLLQIIHADWKRDKAHQITLGLLERHKNTAAIWAASDVMAAGVADAIRISGKQAGKDVLTGGVDWTPMGLEMVSEGPFSTTIGGHFMDGGWVMVMVYDQMHGVNIPRSGTSNFSSITADNVEMYRNAFGDGDWDQIDFRRFSKHLNPELKEYEFGLKAILKQIR